MFFSFLKLTLRNLIEIIIYLFIYLIYPKTCRKGAHTYRPLFLSQIRKPINKKSLALPLLLLSFAFFCRVKIPQIIRIRSVPQTLLTKRRMSVGNDVWVRRLILFLLFRIIYFRPTSLQLKDSEVY